MYAETFNHTGPGIVNHMIDGANLTVNQHYNLRLVINVNDTTFENFQNFGKLTIILQ